MEFKEIEFIPRESGVYKIENIINKKVYIGESKNLRTRYKSHRKELSRNRHINKFLQEDVLEFGIENLKFSVLELCEVSKLTEREHFWIDFYKSLDRNFGYNIVKNNKKNKEISEETRNKLIESHKGKIPANKGLKESAEIVENKRIRATGKKASEAQLEKMRKLKVTQGLIKVNSKFNSVGVSENRGRYIARITFDAKTENLGSFSTLEEAKLAYDFRAIELYGDGARTNFSKEEISKSQRPFPKRRNKK